MGIILLVLIAGYVMSNGNSDSSSDRTEKNVLSGDVQKVIIGFKNGNYYPNTIRVKVGESVSISLDNSVFGCYRSFTIRDLGVSKYLGKVTDSVDFTPTKVGTYAFACSMGMGTGKIIVE